MGFDASFVRRSDFLVFGWFFAGLLALATICERLQPRVYESTGVLELAVSLIRVMSVVSPDLLSEKPLSVGQVDFQYIAQQIPSTALAAFLKPYGYGPDAGTAVIVDVLKSNVSIAHLHHSVLVQISYRHPDPRVALQIDELVIDERVARYAKIRHDELTADIQYLETRIKQQTLAAGEMEAQARWGILEKLPASEREAAKAYNDELERRYLEAKKIVDVLTQRINEKKQKAEAMESPLRIIDRPVLAGPDDYVRTPIMKVLRWKWAIAGSGGLMAVVVSRFILGRRKHQAIA